MRWIAAGLSLALLLGQVTRVSFKVPQQVLIVYLGRLIMERIAGSDHVESEARLL